MSQTLSKPILLDETGQSIDGHLNTNLSSLNTTESAIKTVLESVGKSVDKDLYMQYTDVESQLDINIKSIATSLSVIKNVMLSSNGIPSWSDGTDEEIISMLNKHYMGLINIYDYWSIGDERTVSLSAIASGWTTNGEAQAAQDIVLVLTEKGGKTLSDGTECIFQVDLKNSLGTTGFMNSTRTYTGGWKSSARRGWCNNQFYNALPSTLRPMFKEFVNQTWNPTTSEVEDTTDKFAFRSEVEVFGTTTASKKGEGELITYYKVSTNRVKAGSTSYWLRSPYKSTENAFVETNSVSNPSPSASYAEGLYCLVPFGVI